MKYISLLSSLLAVAAAAPLAEEAAGTYAAEAEMVPAAEQAEPKASVDMSANGVKILPRFSGTTPKDGAKRTTVKYGTFSVSSTKMMQSTKLAQGPCIGLGCYVTGMEATIRYPDGKEANIDTKAWLHHIALFGSGGGQGSIWACGNERPTLRLNQEAKYGIDFPSAFMLMIDLMTEDTTPKSLTLEITYEHVARTLSGYKAAAMYWLTIGEPSAKDGVYKFSTIPSMSGYSAKLLYAIGHMHDGGTDMRLFVNSKLVCKSVMHYNMRNGYTVGEGATKKTGKTTAKASASEEAPAKAKTAKAKTTKPAKAEEEEEAVEEPAPKKAKSAKASGSMAGMSHSRLRRDGHGGHAGGHGDAMDHISDPGACTDFGTVAKGDRMTAEAWYDAVQHPLMVHNGKKENLMGNMRVYIGPN